MANKNLTAAKKAKNDMSKRFLCLAFAFLLSISVLATPADDYRDALSQQETIKQDMSDRAGETSELLSEIEQIKTELLSLQEEVQREESAVFELDSSIEVLEAEIEGLTTEIADQYTIYYECIRKSEEQGNANYLELLLSSRSISDLLNSYSYIEDVMQYEKQVLLDVEQVEKEAEQKKEALADVRADRNAALSRLRVTQSKLSVTIDLYMERIRENEEKMSEAKEELSRLKGIADDLKRQLDSQAAPASQDPIAVFQKYVIDSGEYMRSPGGAEIVRYALQFLGGRYIWGGAKPSDGGFDCSGLVYYVYAQYGYSLHRVASQQYKYDGVAVEKEALVPGDLIIFRHLDTTDVRHIGIYIGDGYMLHASSPETGIKVSNLRSSWYEACYMGAKRIIPN